MQLFYIPTIDGNTCVLSEEESWHCTKVLRLHEGDEINLTDGKGNLYTGRLAKVNHKGCLVEILGVKPGQSNGWHLHIAIAPTKNIDRFEWFLEKSTEIGVDEITPVVCEHSERNHLKTERLKKVIIAAMKQSLKTFLPDLNNPFDLLKFISLPFNGQKFIAYCDSPATVGLDKVYSAGSNALVLIGHEGDFSKEEIEVAKKAGFIPITLGKSRLRTETAGIVACTIINFLNQYKIDE